METTEYLAQRVADLCNQGNRLNADLVAVKADFHKFEVALAVMELGADLPDGSTISLLYFDDDVVNDHYDIALHTAYADGEELRDFQDEGLCWPMGWADGEHTDIDDFLDTDGEEIDVDKVRAWVASIAPTTITILDSPPDTV